MGKQVNSGFLEKILGKKFGSMSETFINKTLGHAKLLGMLAMELEVALAAVQAVRGIINAEQMKKQGIQGWKEDMVMSVLGGVITTVGGISGAGSSLSRIGSKLNKLSNIGGYISSVGGIGMETAVIGIQAKSHTGKWYNYAMESGAVAIGSYELGTAMLGNTHSYQELDKSTGLNRYSDKMLEEPGNYSTNDFEKEYGNRLASKNIRGYETYNRATFGMLTGMGIKVVSSIDDVEYSVQKYNSMISSSATGGTTGTTGTTSMTSMTEPSSSSSTVAPVGVTSSNRNSVQPTYLLGTPGIQRNS